MRTVRHASHAQHHTLHPKDPNPYFQHSPTLSMAASPVASPLKNPVERISSPLAGQPRNPAPVSAPSPARSVSPASMVGSFPPFAGTSPNDFAFASMQDRFPFSGTDAHTATAIRG